MYVLSFFIAFILGLIFTPIAKLVAQKLNIVDSPITVVKTHRKATPYLGGVAIALSILGTLLILIKFFKTDIEKEMYIILISSVVIVILGFIDDIKDISPFKKICIQFSTAVLVVLTGTKIILTNIEIVDATLTILWIVAITNAFNLIDIMDGLAAGIAIIVSVVLSVIFFQMNEMFPSLLLLSLAGSCLGFLKYNFNPAKIFMGDTGSLFMGFLLACTSINFISRNQINQSTLIIFFVFGIPMFETIFVSILRIKNGRSPLIGSKDHFALRMVKSGLTVKKTVLVTYLIAVLLGAIALISFNFKNLTVYFFMTISVAAIFIAKKLGRINMSDS